MPTLSFPTNTVNSVAVPIQGLDSKAFKVKQNNPAIRKEVEAGYVVTRPRFTRRPRRVFSLSYVDINDADKNLLENFYNTTKGGSLSFNWTNPVDSTVIAVRFVAEMNWSYSGIGTRKMWSVTFDLEEV